MYPSRGTGVKLQATRIGFWSGLPLRNSEMTLGLWDTCLCEHINPAGCNWAGASIFGGARCARFVAFVALGWASAGLLVVAFFLCVFAGGVAGVLVCVPLSLACNLTSILLVASTGLWHGTGALGEVIGRALYFAVFSEMLQLWLLGAAMYVHLAPGAKYMAVDSHD